MKLMEAYDFVCYAEKQILENRMSPDAVCGEAKLSGRFNKTVCTKTLYNYIDKRMLKVRNVDLPLKVKKKPNRQMQKKQAAIRHEHRGKMR